jgi:hypothetical protein
LNKRGIGLLWIIGIVGIVAIVASILGIVFINKFVDAIGTKNLTWIAIFILLIVFRQIITTIVLTLWGVIRGIFKI